MLEHPKALSTNSFYIISENLKDAVLRTKMDNQQGILIINSNNFTPPHY